MTFYESVAISFRQLKERESRSGYKQVTAQSKNLVFLNLRPAHCLPSFTEVSVLKNRSNYIFILSSVFMEFSFSGYSVSAPSVDTHTPPLTQDITTKFNQHNPSNLKPSHKKQRFTDTFKHPALFSHSKLS